MPAHQTMTHSASQHLSMICWLILHQAATMDWIVDSNDGFDSSKQKVLKQKISQNF